MSAGDKGGGQNEQGVTAHKNPPECRAPWWRDSAIKELTTRCCAVLTVLHNPTR